MRIIVLDGKRMTDRGAAHDYLTRALDLPSYYGRNLDALCDCLRDRPHVIIALVSADAMLRALGVYGERLLSVFRDAASDGAIDLMLPRGEEDIA